MAIRDIVLYPDDVLREKCKPVEDVLAPEIQQLIDDMIETMYDAPGVGLAAPQVGVPVRITVIDVCNREEGEESQLRVLVNPEIVERSGSITWEEGCLSIPGVFSDVKRAARVKVRALGRDGHPYEFEAEELLAVCVQHEIDHLDGVLFLDHLSRLKLRMALKTYKRTKEQYLADKAKKDEERGGDGHVPDSEAGSPEVAAAKSC